MKIDPVQPALPGAAAPRAAGDQLEQAFLEEMMKYAFPKPEGGAFAGGAGEEQFTSFLNREYAITLAESLDFGLARALEKDA